MDCNTLFHVIFLFFISRFFFKSAIAVDAIVPNQTLLDNGTTLVSQNGNFELGFFSPWNSGNRHVGIWFKKVSERTVVWVANKNAPITDLSGFLTITSSGNIIISNNQSNIVWNASSPSAAVSNPILKLLDNGNLVLKNDTSDDDNPGSYLWQSFDYPCDTLIPGMKLGWNLRTNQERYLTSWKSTQDPSPGDFTYRMNTGGLPSIILRRGPNITFRSGPWDGVRFGGATALHQNPVFNPIFVYNSNYVYYGFENTDVSIISRFVINQSGLLEHLTWSQTRNQWIEIATMKSDTCDDYAKCGNFGVCDIDRSPICACLNGFMPRLRQDWLQFDWTGGCLRRVPLNCSVPTGFRKIPKLKLPDSSTFMLNSTTTSLEECRQACLSKCSCVAYARTQASGCLHWLGDLVDMRMYVTGGQDLFVRMPLSELDSSSNSKRVIVITSVSVVSLLVLLALTIWLIICWRATKNKTVLTDQKHDNPSEDNDQSIDEDLDLPLFNFLTISAATDGFSFANKIGEGGFGPVYKGELQDGQKIAVKRLSENSSQGFQEFKNEANSVAQLQHRNLTKLLGCCSHGEERMLVYEYMPNKSLDQFIFEPARKRLLPWEKRISILKGIAKGLDYLHSGSRLRLIHRDLKASNILLDEEMNPKISDFGLAKNFENDGGETTRRVIGTHGYMSPEYVMAGHYSTKSDVFSFGVLALEIISGKRNWGFHHPDHELNLLGHAWKLWIEGRNLALIDPVLEESFVETGVTRCIQVGLLCAQHSSEKRPTMSQVVFMLENENVRLPEPQEPGFFSGKTGRGIDSSLGWNPDSVNWLTITALTGRV